MKQLPEIIRDKLIAIGQDVRKGVQPHFADVEYLQPYDAINRKSPEFWHNVAAGINDEQLSSLICALTYVENHLRWLGGSASGVIWLFKSLVSRGASITLLDEVSSWVIKHTQNPYNPFGMRDGLGARNYSEYKILSQKRQLLIQHKLEEDKKKHKIAEKQRKRRKELRLLNTQHRDSSERKKLIEILNRMSLRDQLILISKDDKHLPNFYPTKCATSADITVIESLPKEVRYALAHKMKGKYRGPWGTFKKRLLSVCETVGDKES